MIFCRKRSFVGQKSYFRSILDSFRDAFEKPSCTMKSLAIELSSWTLLFFFLNSVIGYCNRLVPRRHPFERVRVQLRLRPPMATLSMLSKPLYLRLSGVRGLVLRFLFELRERIASFQASILTRCHNSSS